jgi:sugar/nucleoside kinase (ribokinase family)
MTMTASHGQQGGGRFQLDSFTTSAVDAVGAGDALLAYASLALKVSGSPQQAAILGSIAAACECEVDGNVPVSHAEVAARIDAIERVATFAS